MDLETFRSLHRYGAILSVLTLVLAPLALAVGGRLEPVGISLAFFGSLCGFYFVGAVLEEGGLAIWRRRWRGAEASRAGLNRPSVGRGGRSRASGRRPRGR